MLNKRFGERVPLFLTASAFKGDVEAGGCVVAGVLVFWEVLFLLGEKKEKTNQTKLLLVFPVKDFCMCCSAGSKPKLAEHWLWRPDPSSFCLWGCSRLYQHLCSEECADWIVCIYSDCVATKISQVPFYSGGIWFEKHRNTGCILVIQELGYRYSGSLFLVQCRSEGKENFWEVFHGFHQIPF